MPPLLKPRPAPPRTRKISFKAPEDLVDEMEALAARADALGYDLPLNDALVDAYRKLARRIGEELGDEAGDGNVGGAEHELAAHGPVATAPRPNLDAAE